MRRNSDKRPVVTTATGSPTAEHRKAGRDGQIALDGALAFLVISGIAAVAGHLAIASTAAGICVALVVVGLMLHYEGERQRQRPDRSPPHHGK